MSRTQKQKQHRSPQPKRAVSKDTAKAVIVYFPTPIVEAVDRQALAADTDRSKWIRKAIRDALSQNNIPVS